jgi:hypothetical protein
MMTGLRAFVCCAGHLKRGAAYNYSSGALKKRLAVQPAGAAGALELYEICSPMGNICMLSCNGLFSQHVLA